MACFFLWRIPRDAGPSPEPIQGTSSLVEQRLVQAAGEMVPPTLTLIEVPEMMAWVVRCRRRWGKKNIYIYLLVVSNIFYFPYIGNNHPNWLIFFRGLKPPTSIIYIYGMIVGYLIYSDMTLIVGLLFLGFENGTIIGDLAEADGNALMEWPTLRGKHIYGSLRSHYFTPGGKKWKK